MVADALTKSRSDFSRPTAAFRSFVDAKLLNRVRFTIQAHMARLSCCLRLNKTRGFRFTIKAHRDEFIGAERAEMTSYKSEQNLPR